MNWVGFASGINYPNSIKMEILKIDAHGCANVGEDMLLSPVSSSSKRSESDEAEPIRRCREPTGDMVCMLLGLGESGWISLMLYDLLLSAGSWSIWISLFRYNPTRKNRPFRYRTKKADQLA